jgi:hypothetical protein
MLGQVGKYSKILDICPQFFFLRGIFFLYAETFLFVPEKIFCARKHFQPPRIFYAWPSGEVFQDLRYLPTVFFFARNFFFVCGNIFICPRKNILCTKTFSTPPDFFFHRPDFCFCSPKTFWCSAEIVGHPRNFIHFPENSWFIHFFFVSPCADGLFPAILGTP